uniref:Uncharacterized protein n=1 Tax=Ceratitis capitata TaxID=7213 RepID=W8BY73_CERCA
MKRKRFQKKQCVDLVQLIKNRPRNTPYSLQNASCSRRNLNRNFSGGNFACTSLHDSGRRHKCQCFLPKRLQQSAHTQIFQNVHRSTFFNASNSESRNNSGYSNSEDHSLKRTSSNPEIGGPNNNSQFTLLSYELINNFILNENENQLNQPSDPDYVGKLNELIPPVESNIEIPSQYSADALDFSNANETGGIHSSSEESPLQQETTTSIVERTVSRQVLNDEEAGGDGPHNNSIIEIEITLQSSNETNSVEEDGRDDNEDDNEGREE